MPRTRLLPIAHGLLCAALLGALAIGGAAPAAGTSTAHTTAVSETPVGWTPHVLDGTVRDIVQVGDVVVVGGDFTEVSTPDGSHTVSRRNLFAFEYGTGRILDGFAPDLNGSVRSLAAADGAVIVGGFFTRVNGDGQRGITRLSLRDGARTPGFAHAGLDNGRIYSLAAHGDDLYVAGAFTSVNGTARTGLARLDAHDGTVDQRFDISLSSSRNGPLRVNELALSPRGERLVVNGTFHVVEDRPRPQIAMLHTGGAAPRLSDWSTDAFEEDCGTSNMHTYMRQMDFSPDGSYFALVTTGSPMPAGLCKTASRWEADDTPDAQPTWVNHTGGDSLYSVAVSGAAVYVGGHQRWLDNPEGRKSPGPGAASRPGIGAIHPETGQALEWNPGRTRGYGVEALTITPGGLFVGSDTERLAGRYHARLGMFPVR